MPPILLPPMLRSSPPRVPVLLSCIHIDFPPPSSRATETLLRSSSPPTSTLLPPCLHRIPYSHGIPTFVPPSPTFRAPTVVRPTSPVIDFPYPAEVTQASANIPPVKEESSQFQIRHNHHVTAGLADSTAPRNPTQNHRHPSTQVSKSCRITLTSAHYSYMEETRKKYPIWSVFVCQPNFCQYTTTTTVVNEM